MIHLFKLNGHRIAFDTDTRTSHPISTLALKIAECVTPPLSEECPSSLRYAFAKYDSHDLSEAYAEVYDMWKSKTMDNTVSPSVYPSTHVLHVNGETAIDELRRHKNAGHMPLRVFLTGASIAQIEAIRSEFPCEDVCLICDLSPNAVSEEELDRLNRAACYISLPAGDSLTAAVTSAKERGIRYIHTDLPDDTDSKELTRLAKSLELWQGDDITVYFSPFVFALDTEYSEGDLPAGCKECWAQPICQGRCARESGLSSARCDRQRTCTECGIVLYENSKKIV